jgi:hypothetical protein
LHTPTGRLRRPQHALGQELGSLFDHFEQEFPKLRQIPGVSYAEAMVRTRLGSAILKEVADFDVERSSNLAERPDGHAADAFSFWCACRYATPIRSANCCRVKAIPS